MNDTEGNVKPFNIFQWGGMYYSCEGFGKKVTSNGLFTKDNPLGRPVSLLILQLGVVLLISSLIHRLLRPFKQPRFVSDMLTGILLGPLLREIKIDGFQSLFEGKQSIVIDVLELLCHMYFIFLVGVRTDLDVIKTSGIRAWIIGIASFFLPLALAMPAAERVKSKEPINPFGVVSGLEATTSFHVTAVLLSDLNLLNSEIGRLALSSSLISNLLGLFFKTLYAMLRQAVFYNSIDKSASINSMVLKTEGSRLLTVIFLAIVPRKIMFLMMKKIPEGKPIQEWHFAVISCMLLAVGCWCEYFGINAYFGALILGFMIPAGPPIGSGVIQKIGIVVSTLFVPSYIIDAGRHVNLSLITKENFGNAEIVIILAYIGKFAAAAVPSLLYKMPKTDAVSLGLILSSQGFFDIMQFKRALRFSMIKEDLYTILTITAVFNSAIFTPLICYLYDPSKRYANYRKRTIQHAKRDGELKLLVCLHEEESAFGVMNLLKASYPTREQPLGIYILDLIELSGREHPLLINHQFHKRKSSNLTRTDRIINSFSHFEAQHEGLFRNQYFTTITPFASMHDDICTTALEKSTSLIIIPFQRHESRAVKLVKKNMLDKAPCSVGFLIDKKIITYFVSDSIKVKTFNMCVIFFGGPDSREALAYGTRMVESPVTNLTVIRLLAEDDELVTDLVEARIDLKVINELRGCASVNDRIEYKEVVVQDGAETSKVLTSLEDVYDYILVGKRIDKDSSLVDGLTEWDNQVEAELGIIGDILASSDMKSKASVLVLQQQSTVEDLVKKWN